MGLGQRTSLALNTANMVLYLLLVPAAGWASDRLGRRAPLLVGAAAATLVLAYPIWAMFEPGRPAAAWGAQALLVSLLAVFTGPLAATLVSLFPAETRCTGLSIGHNLSMALFGGTAPFIATAMIKGTHNTAAPAGLMIIGAAISLGGLYLCTRRLGLR